MDLNKCVFRAVLNESNVVEARMWTGRLFQRVGVANIEKERFPASAGDRNRVKFQVGGRFSRTCNHW